MSLTTERTSLSTSMRCFVVISPPTMTRPRATNVSQATRPVGSSARTASSTASEIWSQTLSGWPSVTDSELKKNLPLRCMDESSAAVLWAVSADGSIVILYQYPGSGAGPALPDFEMRGLHAQAIIGGD